MVDTLFDSEFLVKLEKLALITKRLHRGRSRGEHQSYRKGTSLEFEDYRPYMPGDDFRYIDWNAYQRLNKIMVKRFKAEEDLSVHIILDTSASMIYGTPSKLDYAKQLGAALSYVAMTNLDRIGITAFSDKLNQELTPVRRKNLMPVLDYFSRIQGEGETQFNQALKAYALKTRRPGLAIIISDLLSPEGYEEGLLSLLYRKFDILVLQVLTEDEFTPSYRGMLKLVDEESKSSLKLGVEKKEVRMYQKFLTEYLGKIEGFCLNRGIEYLRTTTSVPFEEIILKYLRQGMYLK